MKERLVKVKLGGFLGRSFGRNHEFRVSSTKELMKAMCLQIKGFKKALEDSDSKGLGFVVFNGKHNLRSNGSDLAMPCKDEVRIIPAYLGSKRGGILQVILGVVLIAASYFGAPTAPIGIAMLVGGVVQMMTPQPQGLKVKEDTANQSSYGFGGPVNTTAQGNPLGLLYGYREVGGAIVSAGIIAEDQN
jgi:predicted phage tail protein